MADSKTGILALKYKSVCETAKVADGIASDIVLRFSAQLDEFMTAIETMLDNIRDGDSNFDDDTLRRAVLRLPILMYRLIDATDQAMLSVDVAKAAQKLVFAHHFMDTEGPIKEREMRAEKLTAEETDVIDLAKHVYQRLKARIDTADSMFDALRKVLTSRDNEKATFRKDKS